MALIGAILVEIKTIEILCKRLLGEGDRQALSHSIVNKVCPIVLTIPKTKNYS